MNPQAKPSINVFNVCAYDASGDKDDDAQPAVYEV